MEKKWWHDKFVYQIYPKSFKDSKTNEIVYDTNFISNADLDSEDDVLFDYEI